MSEYTTADIESAIRTGVIALVAVLGIPAAVYFGLRGLLSAGMANGLGFVSSIIAALSIVALLLWYSG